MKAYKVEYYETTKKVAYLRAESMEDAKTKVENEDVYKEFVEEIIGKEILEITIEKNKKIPKRKHICGLSCGFGDDCTYIGSNLEKHDFEECVGNCIYCEQERQLPYHQRGECLVDCYHCRMEKHKEMLKKWGL